MNKIDEILNGVNHVIISGHVRPDGDCVGSTLAMYNYINKVFPNMKLELFLEKSPTKFSFLKNYDKLEILTEEREITECDLFISLDCGDISRLGLSGVFFDKAKKTLCIDHHISNQEFADINVIDPAASSTCELVFDLIDKDYLDKEIAECLYTGLVSDSGVFQYSCTSSKTMQIAGVLMDQGINYPWIVQHTFFEKTFEQIQITALAFTKAKRYLNDQMVVSVIDRKEMEEYHVFPRHLDGISSELRSVRGVEMSLFLYQNEEDGYKLSMRSSERVDVSKIAMNHGGGGHARAAGATITRMTPEMIIEMIVKEVEEQMY